MPLNPPVPSAALPSQTSSAARQAEPVSRASMAIAAASILLIAAMAVTGRADPIASLMAAGVIAALWAAMTFRVRRPRETARGELGVGPTPSSLDEIQTYVLALELAPNPVLLVIGGDTDDISARRILFANAEARELLRIAREGALLVTAVRHPAVLEAIDEALYGRTARVLNYESGGGQERFWRVWTKPLPPSQLYPRLALVIMRDETDVRLNERMRADFLANASHELRTPLASLTGFIETLRGHAREDVAARDRFLVIMARQAERMARLIDDLLSLSRIELNEHIRPDGACDLSLAVGDVVDALAPQVSGKAVKLVCELPPTGGPTIVGDRDQIVQVVQNLLDNAIKYAPAGGVVSVSVLAGLSLESASAPRQGDVRQGAANGGRMSLLTPVRASAERYALLRIEDSGPGMAREHLPRLTERFYRVEGQRSGERLGTGLGLAIVKHIVNRHRGGFVVESAPDQGAAFSVYLPMTAADARQPVQDAEPAAPVSSGAGDVIASHTSRAA